MNAVRMGPITAIRTQRALIAKEVSLVRVILVSKEMALRVQVICYSGDDFFIQTSKLRYLEWVSVKMRV